MSISSTTRLAVAVGAAAALAVAAPAAAATHAPAGHAPAAHSAAGHHRHHHHVRFAARGVVVRHSAHHVTVLARTLHRGAKVRHDARIRVAIPRKHAAHGAAIRHHLRHLHNGDRIVARGMISGHGRNLRFSLTHVEDEAAPFDVFVGTVTAVDGTLVTLSELDDSSSDAVRPDSHGDHGGGDDAITVDVSSAAISVDGVSGSLAVGQTAVVLGSYIDGDVVATSVFAFSSSPDIAEGEVQSVDGSIATICDGHGGHGPDRVTAARLSPMDHGSGCEQNDSRHDGSDDNTITMVDLSNAALIVDGNSGATVDQIVPGSELVAVGTTDDAGTLDATLAVDFARDCSSRHHGDGGDDDGPGHD